MDPNQRPNGGAAENTLPALTLVSVNAGVYRVHQSDGLHLGNLKKVGSMWKFKAVGYDASGAVEPGGGPLTARHNTVFDTPDATTVNLQLAPDRA
jgi:hypothetical protein